MSEQQLARLLQKAKTALRQKNPQFDDEVIDLIKSGIQDLETRGVVIDTSKDLEPIVQRCVLTYVRMNFGQPDDYDRLKESFDEQLGQLMTTTGFTVWG